MIFFLFITYQYVSFVLLAFKAKGNVFIYNALAFPTRFVFV